jgi:GNAT superfamily N-acetyltransferase
MTTVAEPPHDIVLTHEAQPDANTIRTFKQGVDDFNFAAVGPDGYASVWIIGRDRAGSVQAGLYAQAAWTWLFLDWLWVAEAHRGHGVGTRLLLRAEAAARDRGCCGVYLNTFSFQAPAFYERHSYREFGRLQGMPPGHDRIWLGKML